MTQQQFQLSSRQLQLTDPPHNLKQLPLKLLHFQLHAVQVRDILWRLCARGAA
jgi:hypothetical protein